MNEFDIIKQYFTTQMLHRPDVVRGIGDDAAIVAAPPGMQLAITTDTLIADVHFAESALPYDIGYKSLAVNLSDLAAMGATPAWMTLALTLPHMNEDWLRNFCTGFFTLANRYAIQLIGGDLTHGPLSITVQALGFVPSQKALLRSGARPSDLVYVTGTLGDAGLALASLQQKVKITAPYERSIMEKLHRPEPRVAMGQLLLDYASSAIDISDGFAADLNHILEQSHVGALITVDKLPLSEALQHSLPPEKALGLALTAGDDYELCFTVPANKREEVESRLSSSPCHYTLIGVITEQPGLQLKYQDGKKYDGLTQGYQHF